MGSMRNWYWIVVGAVAGLGAGAIFGVDYALAGMAMGLAGGGAIAFVLR